MTTVVKFFTMKLEVKAIKRFNQKEHPETRMKNGLHTLLFMDGIPKESGQRSLVATI
jgi:hypothetical protein